MLHKLAVRTWYFMCDISIMVFIFTMSQVSYQGHFYILKMILNRLDKVIFYRYHPSVIFRRSWIMSSEITLLSHNWFSTCTNQRITRKHSYLVVVFYQIAGVIVAKWFLNIRVYSSGFSSSGCCTTRSSLWYKCWTCCCKRSINATVYLH